MSIEGIGFDLVRRYNAIYYCSLKYTLYLRPSYENYEYVNIFYLFLHSICMSVYKSPPYFWQ